MEERNELHILYRPQNFDEYIGGKALKEGILGVINSNRTFLLYGMRGCGKTTLARLIAYYHNINDINIHEIDAADKTGIEDARKIKKSIGYAPMGGEYKAYIFDEAHRLSGNAWDSLLKTLEQPPSHCFFILCTTEFNKIPVTIKSRAKSFEVKPLMKKDAISLINWVCENEGIKLSEEIKKTILDNCEGVPREIVSAIDMARNIENNENAISLISSTRGDKNVLDLCQELLKASPKWENITKIIRALSEDPENIRYAILAYMYSVLLNTKNHRAAQLIQIFSESFLYTKKSGLLLSCYLATSDN